MSKQVAELPSVTQLVDFLDVADPSVLKSLRDRYPQEADHLLRRGCDLGPCADTELALRMEVAAATLSCIIQWCEERLPRLSERIRRAGAFQFTGQLITAVGGASVFGVMAANLQDVSRYAVASLALAGTVCTLISTYLNKLSGYKAGNLTEFFQAVVSCQVKAERLARELSIWNKCGQETETGSQLVSETNTLYETFDELRYAVI